MTALRAGLGNRGLVALLSVASVLGMLGSSSFSALLPEFQSAWGLSNTEAGWISGIYFGGYVAGVPVLVGATDRIDARRVYLVSLAIGAAASVGYALFADGFLSAFGFRALAGLGLAGTYMPGLKLMTDRIGQHPRQGRYVAYYTAGFSLGTAASFAFTAELAQWFGWRWAFGGAAIGAGLAFLLVWALVPPAAAAEPEPQVEPRRVLDFRPVFANRAALRFILGYTGHTWELFAMRSWLVAFLIYAQGVHGEKADLSRASWITMVVVLLGTASSIYGAEAASRGDRGTVIGRVMIISVIAAAVTGFSAPLPMAVVVALCLIYHLLIMADSAALTGGAVAMSRPGQRGATLAVHSILGFGGGFLGPLAVGLVLDLMGGAASNLAWGMAFLAMGAGSAAAFAAMRKL